MNAEGVPIGFGVELDADTVIIDGRTIVGGSPRTVLRLSTTGARVLAELRAGTVRTPTGALLARRLIDAGAAHPLAIGPAAAGTSRPDAAGDVTIVIPVCDRPELLAECLAAVGGRYPVVVVDDASRAAPAIAAVADRFGATLIRREHNGGPGAARNDGLRATTSEFVALLDSDCVPSGDWIGALLPHLTDPLVGVVAPRIVPFTPEISPTVSAAAAVQRYGAVAGALDLGLRPARVAPGSRVSYLPTAAILIRRKALTEVSNAEHDPFDETMRVGEDVDLVWRLHEAGWRVRYDPSVTVAHREPQRWIALLGRRFRYGTSTAALAQRHGKRMAPLRVHPLMGATAVLAIAGHPVAATVGFVADAIRTKRRMRSAALPGRFLLKVAASGIGQTWHGLGTYSSQLYAPVTVDLLVRRLRQGRLFSALGLASLLLGPGLLTWWRRRPALGPIPFAVATLADNVSYGAGVWTGALRARSLRSVLPHIVFSTTTAPSSPSSPKG